MSAMASRSRRPITSLLCAPSVIRMLISRVRCATLYAGRPGERTLARAVAFAVPGAEGKARGAAHVSPECGIYDFLAGAAAVAL